MKYIILFLMIIILNSCESSKNFKKPEPSSQQNCNMCNVDDVNSPVFDD